MLILEGGAQHLMRPVLTGQVFPVETLDKSDQEHCAFYLHGPLCTSLDTSGGGLACRLMLNRMIG